MNARLDFLVILRVRLDLEHIQFNERASRLLGNFACSPDLEHIQFNERASGLVGNFAYSPGSRAYPV